MDRTKWWTAVLIVLQLSRMAYCDAPQPFHISPTKVMKQNFGKELPTIIEAARANNCTDDALFTILLAIRKAENGRTGIEFGVLHPRATHQENSLRVQAGWCAATISKTLKRWKESGSELDFIAFLGNRYCPLEAENDPTGLNRHWIKNVRHWVNKLTPQNRRAYLHNRLQISKMAGAE